MSVKSRARAAVKHSREMLFNTTPLNTGAAITLDGGVADTTRGAVTRRGVARGGRVGAVLASVR